MNVKSQFGPVQRIRLDDFIYEIKRQLLEAQQKHCGEPAFFDLQNVELEVKVTTSYSAEAKGKLEFWVVSLGEVGAKTTQDSTHTVKLTFQVQSPALPASSRVVPEKGIHVGSSIVVDKGGIGLPPVRPFGTSFEPVDVEKLAKEITSNLCTKQFLRAAAGVAKGSVKLKP